MNRINVYKNHIYNMSQHITVYKLWKKVNELKSKERSILIQTIDNYNKINQYFPNVEKNNAGCGENITVSGLEIENIFIGDIFTPLLI